MVTHPLTAIPALPGRLRAQARGPHVRWYRWLQHSFHHRCLVERHPVRAPPSSPLV